VGIPAKPNTHSGMIPNTHRSVATLASRLCKRCSASSRQTCPKRSERRMSILLTIQHPSTCPTAVSVINLHGRKTMTDADSTSAERNLWSWRGIPPLVHSTIAGSGGKCRTASRISPFGSPCMKSTTIRDATSAAQRSAETAIMPSQACVPVGVQRLEKPDHAPRWPTSTAWHPDAVRQPWMARRELSNT
jgi:hypothetical protein